MYVALILRRRNLFLTWHWIWFCLKTYLKSWNRKDKETRGLRTKMQHLLKLLDDYHYVSRNKVNEYEVTFWDIFWTYPDSIKFFNTFPIVLIIDSTYKTRKYMLPLQEIVGVTSTYMNFQWVFHFWKASKGTMLHGIWKCERLYWRTKKIFQRSL